MATGLILYAGTGFVSFMKNLNYLDYDVFGSHGQHYGILLIEAGVGITVASTMVMIFYSLLVEEGDEVIALSEIPTEYGLWHYWVVTALMMLGLYMVIAKDNLIACHGPHYLSGLSHHVLRRDG